LQTQCYKFSRQQDTEEIELVSKKSGGGGGGPGKVELIGPEEPGVDSPILPESLTNISHV